MVHITVGDAEGALATIDVPFGTTLKDAILDHGLPGVEGLCGGTATCGTCHVHIDEAWIDRLPPPEEEEALILDFVLDRTAGSRLSCQIVVDDALTGLIARTPERQT